MAVITTADIWSRIFERNWDDLSAEAARSILKLGFEEATLRQINELAAKARAGALSDEEQLALDNYVRVGHMLSLMKSKARVALKKAGVEV